MRLTCLLLVGAGSANALVPACQTCLVNRLRRTTRIVASDFEPLPDSPRDELKVRFNRDTGSSFKTPEEYAAKAAARGSETDLKAKPRETEELLEEIRSLMPKQAPEPPPRVPIDLNGIKPRDLTIGALSYAVVCVLAWQFTNAAALYFSEHDSTSSVYYVNRLTGLARVVVVSMGALGTGITGIASIGQAALAVQISTSIAKGELDPNAERKLPTGKRKLGETERMFRLMLGGGKQIL